MSPGEIRYSNFSILVFPGSAACRTFLLLIVIVLFDLSAAEEAERQVWCWLMGEPPDAHSSPSDFRASQPEGDRNQPDRPNQLPFSRPHPRWSQRSGDHRNHGESAHPEGGCQIEVQPRPPRRSYQRRPTERSRARARSPIGCTERTYKVRRSAQLQRYRI